MSKDLIIIYNPKGGIRFISNKEVFLDNFGFFSKISHNIIIMRGGENYE
jgi:hypothetical protein